MVEGVTVHAPVAARQILTGIGVVVISGALVAVVAGGLFVLVGDLAMSWFGLPLAVATVVILLAWPPVVRRDRRNKLEYEERFERLHGHSS